MTTERVLMRQNVLKKISFIILLFFRKVARVYEKIVLVALSRVSMTRSPFSNATLFHSFLLETQKRIARRMTVLTF